MTLDETQEMYHEGISQANHPRVGSAISLMEEVGEVATAILNIEFYEKSISTEELSDELADVFIAILELCDVYHIDLERAFLKKFAVLKKRAQEEWPDHLEIILKEKRDKFDHE